MIQLDLTPKQVEELKNHYILELEQLQVRSAEIVGILSKLVHGPVSTVTEKPVTSVLPADTTTENTKHRGRPSKTPNLSDFILTILKEKDKPLTTDQLIKQYKKKYNIDLSGSASTLSSLNQSLFRLRKKQNLITSTRRKGKKGNVYSLIGQTVVPEVRNEARKEKKVAPAKEIVKTAPKGKWHQFIVEMLNKHKRTLSLNDFLGYAMVQFSIPAQDKKSTYGKISPVLTNMVKAKDKIRTYKKEGTSRKFYALNDWFTDKNELIAIYK